MRDVVTAILGGGQGARLWPLTKNRAKPAVPVGGKFRLIDIPISNSLHAGINRIFVLTQFNSASLHQHISLTYRFDLFSRGFVNILAAEQSLENRDWYQGTADAVRQNLDRLLFLDPSEVLVLSGDQLYLMDMAEFVRTHRDRQADLTVAVKAVPRSQARGLGIMRIDDGGRIVEFVEKPTEEEELDRLTPSAASLERLGFEGEEGSLLASMGIYVFDPEVLARLLAGTHTDFGKEVIPGAIDAFEIHAFAYNGYWRDIGTIGAFHQANLELTVPVPPLDLYSPDKPIFTHARFLPGVKVHDCTVRYSVLCDGSILEGAEISRSVVGIRSVVRSGTVLDHCVMMGANYFVSDAEEARDDRIPMGIGHDCEIRGAILDRNVRIGDHVRLVNADDVAHADGPDYCIRDGIIVVHQGAEIPDGTEI